MSDDKQRYADQGFLAIPAFCSAAEVAWMRGTLRRLFARRAGRDEGNQFDMLGLDVDTNLARQPQIIKPSVFAPALLRTAYFERLVVVARQLLGPEARFSFDHSILKPAASDAATPWHQDEAHHEHRGNMRYAQVSFWLALQDTPLEMGCMRYIPRSHRGALLAHRPLDDDPRVHAMECPTSLFDESSAVVEPVTAGSCILHDGRTLHSALPNVSDSERLAYIVAFTGPPVRCDEPRLAPSPATHTASMRRRQRWLVRGGVLIHMWRKLRRGLRASPRWHWQKLRALARMWFGWGRWKRS